MPGYDPVIPPKKPSEESCQGEAASGDFSGGIIGAGNKTPSTRGLLSATLGRAYYSLTVARSLAEERGDLGLEADIYELARFVLALRSDVDIGSRRQSPRRVLPLQRRAQRRRRETPTE